jgi:hypothetical protein
MSSGFRRGVNGICALLGFYASYFLTAVSVHSISPIFKGPAGLLVPRRGKETTDLRHVNSMKSADLKVLELLNFFP